MIPNTGQYNNEMKSPATNVVSTVYWLDFFTSYLSYHSNDLTYPIMAIIIHE